MVAHSTAAASGSLRALTVSACNNASCASSVVSALDLDDVIATRIELGADGLAAIAYVGAGGLPKLFHCRNRDCTAGRVSALAGASRSGLEVALAMGSDGLPLVVHRADTASTQVQATHCGNRSCQ